MRFWKLHDRTFCWLFDMFKVTGEYGKKMNVEFYSCFEWNHQNFCLHVCLLPTDISIILLRPSISPEWEIFITSTTLFWHCFQCFFVGLFCFVFCIAICMCMSIHFPLFGDSLMHNHVRFFSVQLDFFFKSSKYCVLLLILHTDGFIFRSLISSLFFRSLLFSAPQIICL